MLIVIYIVSLIVGSILLGASLLLGHHDVDSAPHEGLELDTANHVEFETDSADAGHDLSIGHGAESITTSSGFHDFWLPFISIRFWVFFLCFFGLTGTLFTLLKLAQQWLSLFAAIGMGALIGFSATFFIQRLKKAEVGTAINELDYRGQEGIILLPLAPGGKGKIRLEMCGQLIDLVALNEEDKLLEAGQKVIVIDFRDNQAVVVRAPGFENEHSEQHDGG